MNHITKSNTSFPQLVEIPQPLELHPSVSPLAAELLLKTAEVLARTPERYNQQFIEASQSSCGTACCILGHMRAISGNRPCGHMRLNEIGVTANQFEAICYPPNWPEHLYKQKSLCEYTAAEGIARIEFFLRTGE